MASSRAEAAESDTQNSEVTGWIPTSTSEANIARDTAPIQLFLTECKFDEWAKLTTVAVLIILEARPSVYFRTDYVNAELRQFSVREIAPLP